MAEDEKPARKAPVRRPRKAAEPAPVAVAAAEDEVPATPAPADWASAVVPAPPAGPSAYLASPLDGRYASGPGVTVLALPKRLRFSVRAREENRGEASVALGLDLPARPKSTAERDGVAALWLGPDEWLVVAPIGAGDLAARMAALDGAVSAVEVSHRNVAVRVEGLGAEAVIAEGCPQDLRLSVFPVGAASRTILGKVEVVVWRRGETVFEIEVWRSFADYLWTFLAEAARAPAP